MWSAASNSDKVHAILKCAASHMIQAQISFKNVLEYMFCLKAAQLHQKLPQTCRFPAIIEDKLMFLCVFLFVLFFLVISDNVQKVTCV